MNERRECGRGLFVRIATLGSGVGESQCGSVALTIGLTLPVLIGMIALGAEIGFLLYKQRQMQAVADAAALCGSAFTFVRGSQIQSGVATPCPGNGNIDGQVNALGGTHRGGALMIESMNKARMDSAACAVMSVGLESSKSLTPSIRLMNPSAMICGANGGEVPVL